MLLAAGSTVALVALSDQTRLSPGVEGFAAWVDGARQWLRADGVIDASGRLVALRQAYSLATQQQLSDGEFIDQYSQAVACGHAATSRASSLRDGVAERLVATASPFIASSIQDAITAGTLRLEDLQPATVAGDAEQLAGLYEPFLGQHDRRRRSRHGVFYTPRELAEFIVRRIHQQLRHEFGLADGLADLVTWGEVCERHRHLQLPTAIALDEHFVRILDPAVGGGVFLVAVIETIHRALCDKWTTAGRTPEQIQQAWQEYVPRSLLPRLCGLELMLPAAVMAHWQVFQALTRTGYRFDGDERIRIHLVDTLCDWPEPAARSGAAPFELEAAYAACRQEPFSVVIGNPPFSGISRNKGRWITQLLRGRTCDGQPTASYYRANGERLAERKLWLQDDYVKFLRYAQWRVEATGAGIVGFVTNHGYLDNVTFRGVRQQLLAAFPRISVLDLHGSTKKKECAPGGGRDENVFGIESGVAVGLLRKPLAAIEPLFEFNELWGSRDEKLADLDRGISGGQRVQPQAPYHFFGPRRSEFAAEYDRGVPLTEVMPVNSTVAVTARDSFVVAFDRAELLERMATFRDLAIPDELIRERFFSRSRSTRYPPGDTRGWSLAAARRKMASDPDWQRHVRPCLYRPFDSRWIYWADWMVDWPRPAVNRHLTAIDNLALIARRQMLPTQPCNYFWVSRGIPIDGVIRSDNRGSESAFPMLVTSDPAGGRGTARGNFSRAFIQTMERALQGEWQDAPPAADSTAADSPAADPTAWGPVQLFQYIYAQFHSSEYRDRYAEGLRIDFPRVFVPACESLFWQLSQLGGALIAAHAVGESPAPSRGAGASSRSPCEKTQSVGRGQCAGTVAPHLPVPATPIASRFPRFEVDRILLDEQAAIPHVSADVWEYCVGGHQVCRKWWRDRRGRVPQAQDVATYLQLVDAVRRTLKLTAEIDRCIDTHGGWPTAFR